MTEEQREFSAPIRLIVGIGNNMIQGMAVVYEKGDGTAGLVNVWFHLDLFKKVRFASNGESRIVWTVTKRTGTIGGWFSKPQADVREYWEIKEIVIRRVAIL